MMNTHKNELNYGGLPLQQELQGVFRDVSVIHERIQGAKTRTKVDYYKKKQKKLQEHAVCLLAALQRLPEPPKQEQQGQNTPELDSIVDQATENPDRQGLIRTIDGAHLVFKRQSNDGSFEELWVYKNSTLRDELEIRNAILAGTDIPINQLSSPDGKQKYHVWSSGNIEMLHVIGLPQLIMKLPN